MLIAGLLLGVFLGFIAACLVIAAGRGLWLKVEVDERVHLDHTTTVLHHHYGDADLTVAPAPVPYAVPGRVLRRSATSLPPRRVSRKELGR